MGLRSDYDRGNVALRREGSDYAEQGPRRALPSALREIRSSKVQRCLAAAGTEQDRVVACGGVGLRVKGGGRRHGTNRILGLGHSCINRVYRYDSKTCLLTINGSKRTY